jgi:hypothetical protein
MVKGRADMGVRGSICARVFMEGAGGPGGQTALGKNDLWEQSRGKKQLVHREYQRVSL